MLWIQLYNEITRKFSNFSKTKKDRIPQKYIAAIYLIFLNYKCSYTEVNAWGA